MSRRFFPPLRSASPFVVVGLHSDVPRGNSAPRLDSHIFPVIDCVNISFAVLNVAELRSFASIVSTILSATWHGPDDARATMPHSDASGQEEIISFIKGNLFFNRYFFMFLSLSRIVVSVFTGFFLCESKKKAAAEQQGMRLCWFFEAILGFLDSTRRD